MALKFCIKHILIIEPAVKFFSVFAMQENDSAQDFHQFNSDLVKLNQIQIKLQNLKEKYT